MSRLNVKTIAMTISAGLMFFIAGSSVLYADPSKHKEYRGKHVIHRGHVVRAHPKYVHKHRNVRIVRHYHNYHGYGHYRSDDDAYKWLAFTAITVKILDNINEQQQREHEAAQVAATNAEVGETIIWNKAGASGAVTVVRDGTSTSGRYCREFQHEVTIGGKTESAYGIACRQPDGAWEIISTGS